jgi:hypothetical protein
VCNGRFRRLAKIIERPDGDLIIAIFAGLNREDSATDRIKDIHFSVHQSKKIPQGNLIKMTVSSVEESPLKNYAFTSGIKGREGFWHVLSYRYTGMEADYFDMPEAEDNFVIPIGFERETGVLTLGVFVAGAEEEFLTDSEFYTHSIITKHFNVTLLVAISNLGALPFGNFYVPKTFNPLAPTDGITTEQAFKLMRGVSADVCVKRFRISVIKMLLNSLEKLLQQCNLHDVAISDEGLANLKYKYRKLEYQMYDLIRASPEDYPLEPNLPPDYSVRPNSPILLRFKN